MSVNTILLNQLAKPIQGKAEAFLTTKNEGSYILLMASTAGILNIGTCESL